MRYRLLGPSGLRVSELCLGAMTFGTEWHIGADRQTSHAVFDAFVAAGGNFIDVANNYACGTSERLLGEFIANDRDRFVVATKYTLADRSHDPSFSGNHRKNLMRSVRESLKRLQTDHIDLLWVHAWDFTTPVEEVMRGLDDLVSRGVVHYVGFSDTPAWVVSQAATLSSLRGWTPVVAVQGEYSLIKRDAERDLLPMCQALGLGFLSWGSLAGGALTGKYVRGESGRVDPSHARRGERADGIVAQVLRIAAAAGVPPAAVALGWLRHRAPCVLPLVGARKVDQLRESLACLAVNLPPEALADLDAASRIELGFPHDFLSGAHLDRMMGETLSRIDGERVGR